MFSNGPPPPRTIGPPVMGSPLCVLFVDFAEALADPLNYLGKLGKHKKQLEVFFPEDEETEQVSGVPWGSLGPAT